MASAIREFLERLGRFETEVAQTAAEPWRAALLAILQQLELGVGMSVSSSTIPATIIAYTERLANAQLVNARREVLPRRPEGVTEASVLDRKADFVRLLAELPSGPELEDWLVSLASEAVLDGDELALHCLAGGPLDFYYRARGLDPLSVRERILSLLGRTTEAKALRLFTGPTGVGALIMEARLVIADQKLVDGFRQEMMEAHLELEGIPPEEYPEEESERWLKELDEDLQRLVSQLDWPDGGHGQPQPPGPGHEPDDDGLREP